MDDGGGDGGRVKVRWTSVDALPKFVDPVMNPRVRLTGPRLITVILRTLAARRTNINLFVQNILSPLILVPTTPRPLEGITILAS
jgi:hypothetical protein